MRVIAQQGDCDVPYEIAIFRIDKYMGGGKADVVAIVNTEIGILASYSTEEKALKSLEMMRKQYRDLETVKHFTHGNVTNVDGCEDTIIKIRDEHIFQFPKDEDVEV